jgi:hypothetical protein
MAAFSALFAALLMTTNPAAGSPVQMLVDEAPHGITIKLVGSADEPCEATYALEVASGEDGNANRSVQRGTARLRPGPLANLATVALGNSAARGWTAKLTVVDCKGRRFEQERKGAASD